jgi:mercuric ion transport protein
MSTKNSSSKSAGAGLLVAITASLCCITPVLALVSGVSGIAASFSWLEPLRPFMIGLTIAVLGFAWYQLLKPKPVDVDCACEPGEEEKTPFMQTKTFLGMVTVFAGLMLAFPHYSSIFYPEVTKNVSVSEPFEVRQIKLEVAGMTCTSCEEHIDHAAMEVAGVVNSSSNFEKGEAIISFNEATSSQQEIIDAINATGYKVVSTEAINRTDSPVITVGNNLSLSEVALPVAGMTCTGCEDHINYEVSKLTGVSEVKASYDKGNTVVKFDPKKTSKEEIVKAINGTGYTVKETINTAGN